MKHVLFRSLHLVGLLYCVFPGNLAAAESLTDYQSLAVTLCEQPQLIPEKLASHDYSENEIIVRGSRLGTEKLYVSDSGSFKLDIIEPVGRSRRTALSSSPSRDITQPGVWMMLDANCELVEARQAIFDKDGIPLYIQTLDQSLVPLQQKEWLNPPLPASGTTTGLRVALIDSGVNYTLQSIAESLAIDDAGDLIGYDYWDNDKTPFDANPARSWFILQRHGTRTASILLNEAPGIALVPFRYPRPDMSRMTQLVERAANNKIRIIGMPLGSNKNSEWRDFSRAVEKHPDILFIVSAGNNGRDIDLNPVYPAVLDHANILVVTSADDFVQPASRTNYGRVSVDYLLPAENLLSTDFDGSQIRVSGSSYAVSRMTALAARLLSEQTDMSLIDLKSRIKSLSVRASTSRYVSTGYLGDPLADTARLVSKLDDTVNFTPTESQHKIPLNLVALDPRWTTAKINNALQEVDSLYTQCGFSITADSLIRVQGAPYIANQSPGNALTLSRHLEGKLIPEAVTVYFANDTDMQTKFDAEAFGKDNTGTRPWMKNSVWLTSVTPDTGIAIAHELYHVLTNSGHHSDSRNNLMQNRTSPDNKELTETQCQSAIQTALSNGLMH